ncbi:Sec-independent protein translocase subunit TatA/TatB [Elioraea sp.]|jgi:TatA/E family protein of Tat protein translocase|uniref:Sec-independent protein translocase subunit TatA/TatB n=1 Tax=Elioraea sp. TaxID=2185103 RepID=UPI003F72EA13
MSIGIWQIVIAGLVLALLFGSHKIPALAAEAAKGLKSLKREVADAKTESADAPFNEGDAEPKR